MQNYKSCYNLKSMSLITILQDGMLSGGQYVSTFGILNEIFASKGSKSALFLNISKTRSTVSIFTRLSVNYKQN